ncbi:MAG TPA: DUF2971 domain-containing protein, partial [Cytophagaceae bacterium]|nr:DUF2971 domain-containing protein [Cytophagaceae bacterium]
KNISRDFSSSKSTREEHFRKFKEDNKERIRLCSFSERNDSLLMWSHYADSHKGITLEYDVSKNDKIGAYLEPVYYTNKMFDITPFFGKSKDMLPVKMAAITKAEDWQYEKEWRLTFPIFDGNPNGFYKIGNPVAIYLGARFEENLLQHKETLLKIARKENIPIYKMDMHNSEFRIIQIK